MLCYRSAHGVNDVIHDTFIWLGRNWRGFAALWPVVVFVAVLMTWTHDYSEDVIDSPEVFLYHLFPFAYIGRSAYPGREILAYVVSTALVALVVTPLLLRYFADRRSLRGLTVAKASGALVSHLYVSVAVSVLSGLLCYGLCCWHWAIMVLLVPVATIAIPDVMMRRPLLRLPKGDWSLFLSAILLLVVMFALIQALPWLCSDLVELIAAFLISLLPDAITGSDLFIPALRLVVNLAYSVSYCAAVTVYLTGALLLHGVMYHDYAD